MLRNDLIVSLKFDDIGQHSSFFHPQIVIITLLLFEPKHHSPHNNYQLITMPPKPTDPNKVLRGKVDLTARRIGTGDDVHRLRMYSRFPDHKPIRYDREG